MKTKLLLLFLAVLLLITEYFVLLAPAMKQPGDSQSVGTYDFLYYYCPFQVFRRGENPYNPAKLNAELNKIEGSSGHARLIMIYPPWVLLILSPVLIFPFSQAALLFLGLNLILLITSGFLAFKAFSKSSSPYGISFLIASLFFIPAYEAIHWGQISLVILFGLSASVWSLSKKWDWLAGLCLVIATLKPHLLILLGIFLLWYLIQEKRYKVIISYFLCLAIMIVISEIISPEIISNWIANRQIAIEHSLRFRNAVIADVIQSSLLGVSEKLATWSSIFVPSFAAISLLSYLIFRSPLRSFSSHFCIILCLSLISAPYGWFYDQSLLLVVQIYLLAKISQTELKQQSKRSCLLWIFGLQCLTLILKISILESQQDFFWFPLALLFVYWRVENTIKKSLALRPNPSQNMALAL